MGIHTILVPLKFNDEKVGHIEFRPYGEILCFFDSNEVAGQLTSWVRENTPMALVLSFEEVEQEIFGVDERGLTTTTHNVFEKNQEG